MSAVLRAPFPWFGGKSRVASLVWERFGNPGNYVEPFFGSGAVLLGRPHAPKTETVNDLDCYLANFWRAVQAAPDEVAAWAGEPINEADMHARHAWLQDNAAFRERMMTDPHHFDSKVAGWWLWGIGAWLGSGWMDSRSRQIPALSGGRGVHSAALRGQIGDHLRVLAARFSNTRVACGSWERVLSPAITIQLGTTAVFLDPPYSEDEHAVEYAVGTGKVAADVRQWAAENGDNPQLRIALCGYAGEHDEMEAQGWTAVAWKARGGYGSQSDGRGRENAARERVWFSPHCLSGEQGDLLAEMEDAA